MKNVVVRTENKTTRLMILCVSHSGPSIVCTLRLLLSYEGLGQ